MSVLRSTTIRGLAVLVLGVGLTTGTQAATAASTGFITGGTLSGVAGISATDAWAVGTTANGRTLIAHWNGRGWSRSTPYAGNLAAVAAVSATDVWAVGSLILHWNGHSWSRIARPSGSNGVLNGVAATSAGDVWAVGTSFGTSTRTLILHWTGTAWRRMPSPAGQLYSVAATSARNAWAVGTRFVPTLNAGRTFALHWNGSTWTAVPTPGPVGNGAVLNGVTAVASGRTAHTMAVGCTVCGIGGFANSLTAQWTGKAWTVPPGGRVPGGDLFAVATVRDGSAWAVGGRYVQPGNSFSIHTLIRFWDGSRWTTQRSASPGVEAALRGVAATSPTNAWAVGSYDLSTTGANTRTLILHWNGTAWR